MLDQLSDLRAKALAALEETGDADALHAWNATYLGKKGALTPFLRGMGQLPPEERPQVGRAVNEIKQALTAAYEVVDRAWRSYSSVNNERLKKTYDESPSSFQERGTRLYMVKGI